MNSGQKSPRSFLLIPGGRAPTPARDVLNGILFVLFTATAWELLPYGVAHCSGMTCWRRLRDWHAMGIWETLHRRLLDKLNVAGEIDWSRACVDASPVPAKKSGGATRPNPADRGKSGCRRHIMAARNGLPLAFVLTGANVHDSKPLTETADALEPVKQSVDGHANGHIKLHADKGYDYPRCRRELRARHIVPRIARRGVDSSQHLGKHRWVVERTFAWVNQFRRLIIRYERRAEIYHAFLTIAAAIICLRALKQVLLRALS